MKKTTKLLAVLMLAFALVFVLAGCPQDVPGPGPGPGPDQPYEGPLHQDPGYYTFNDAAVTLAANWNNHIYQTDDDSYPIGYITTGLLEFFFNEERDGYVIKPAAAAELPIDVTAEYADEWNLPGEEGYAYKIVLNENVTWQNGEKITADDYVESLKDLLDPKKANYRASDYIDGDLEFAGALEYFWSGRTEERSVHTDYSLDPATTDMWFNVDTYTCYFFGNPMKLYYDNGYDAAFDITVNGETYNFFEKYTGQGNVKVTADMIPEMTAVAQAFGDMNPEAWREFCFYNFKHAEASFEDVGIIKTGEYEFVMVLDKYLTGFYLHYNMTGNWLVYQPYYDDNAKFDETTGYYTNSYNTSVSTTMSYGPYKMTKFQAGKVIEFERNENWFGYADENYDEMYQTDKIVCEEMKEADTRKMAFLRGQLMSYGLQAADYAEGYRNSDRAYFSTKDTAFFFVLNGLESALEAGTNESVNKTIMRNSDFRQALAVSFNKDHFAATVSPARSAAFGIIGTTYIVDPATGATYRETDAAKDVLCRYYGVSYGNPGDLYETVDEAVAAITGYDAELARTLFLRAYETELAAGRITATQRIEIEYATSAKTSFIETTINYLNNALNEILKGSVLENRVMFTLSEDLGNNWSTALKQGDSDTCLCGWTGARMNPFGLTDLYVNPAQAYDAAWFNAGAVEMTLTVEGKELTMSLMDWSNALNGQDVEVDGVKYNFGDGKADLETRVMILAEFEYAILGTGSYIPMLQDSSISLLTRKAEYGVQVEDGVMGYGGLAYLTYNYTDAEWAAYVEECGGEINYKG